VHAFTILSISSVTALVSTVTEISSPVPHMQRRLYTALLGEHMTRNPQVHTECIGSHYQLSYTPSS
jgi:hypothetical protein